MKLTCIGMVISRFIPLKEYKGRFVCLILFSFKRLYSSQVCLSFSNVLLLITKIYFEVLWFGNSSTEHLFLTIPNYRSQFYTLHRVLDSIISYNFSFLHFNYSIAILNKTLIHIFYIVICITCTLSFLQNYWDGNDFTARLYCNYYSCCAKAFYVLLCLLNEKNLFIGNRCVEAVNYSVKRHLY